MTHRIDLYQFTGSLPCQVVALVAKQLNVELNLIEVNIHEDEHLKPEFLALNPCHTLPTIVDNGFVLWESRAIIVYLAEKYGKNHTLYSNEPAERARVNQWLYFDLELYRRTEAMMAEPIFTKIPATQEVIDKALEYFRLFDDMLRGHNSSSLSLADIAMMTTISATEAFGHDFSPYPNIQKWLAWCKQEIHDYEGTHQRVLDHLKAVLLGLK
jgi:glutathione S-transferase